MRKISMVWIIAFVFASVLAAAADTAVTVYNQNFAVVRDMIELDLVRGINDVQFSGTTAHMETDSVILRDPKGKRRLQILEQNYRADPISQSRLLFLYEGKTIEFLVTRKDRVKKVQGKIIRSGYVPQNIGLTRYGNQYYQTQNTYTIGSSQPIIEVDGQLRFQLPGTPLFPALTDDSILKPTLNWLIETDRPGRFNAELSYITGGMSWEADYNVVCEENNDVVDIIGWVTIDNQSGKLFKKAKIKLMAGDVSKIQPGHTPSGYVADALMEKACRSRMQPTVSEKSFDEYHLYTLNRKTTLRDRETKQVEFVRATGVKSKKLYVYNGAKIDFNRYRGWAAESLRNEKSYGTECNKKVWVMREFENSKKNNMGIPLPKGVLRFYTRDADGQMEFTGENTIDHTPKDEKVRVYTGNAFDLVGERKRTQFKRGTARDWLDETFEIKLKNHKEKGNVEIRVVENLYRWVNWKIAQKSHDYIKTDSQTIEFRVNLKPGEEKTVTYKVHYTW